MVEWNEERRNGSEKTGGKGSGREDVWQERRMPSRDAHYVTVMANRASKKEGKKHSILSRWTRLFASAAIDKVQRSIKPFRQLVRSNPLPTLLFIRRISEANPDHGHYRARQFFPPLEITRHDGESSVEISRRLARERLWPVSVQAKQWPAIQSNGVVVIFLFLFPRLASRHLVVIVRQDARRTCR